MCCSASYLSIWTIKSGHKHWSLFSIHSCSHLFLTALPSRLVVYLTSRTSKVLTPPSVPIIIHTLLSMLLMDAKGWGVARLLLPHISMRNFLLLFPWPLSSHSFPTLPSGRMSESVWCEFGRSLLWAVLPYQAGCLYREGIVFCSQPCGLSPSLQKEFQQIWVLD